MIEYRRNLPHILPDHGIFFITFRVKDSLPLKVISELKNNYNHEIELIKSGIKNKKVRSKKLSELYDDYFLAFDELLDKYIHFNLIENNKLASIISECIHYMDNREYKLICYCIMPNHVHLIIYKLQKPLFKIMKVLKGYSARRINIQLNRKGSFWQIESYDNVIRSRNELHNKIQYVLNNPVKARLINNRADWQFSYCNPAFLDE